MSAYSERRQCMPNVPLQYISNSERMRICSHRLMMPYIVVWLHFKIWDFAKCSYSCILKYYWQNEFVENMWPAKSALFIYVSTHCIETVKYLDNTAWSLKKLFWTSQHVLTFYNWLTKRRQKLIPSGVKCNVKTYPYQFQD